MTAVPVRPAASVAVVRTDGDRDEVLLLHRATTHAFAAGVWVFPGGRIEDADERLPPSRWRGLDVEGVADRLHCSPARVLAAHVAAAREAYEEAGLLPVTRVDGSPVGMDDLQDARQAVTDDAGAFSAWLASEDLVVDLGAFTYWARWVTSRTRRRRYDTMFFVCSAPAGWVPTTVGGEITELQWFSPAEALRAEEEGEVSLLLPTRTLLKELAASGVHRLRAELRVNADPSPVLPHYLSDERQEALVPVDDAYPWDDYAEELAALGWPRDAVRAAPHRARPTAKPDRTRAAAPFGATSLQDSVRPRRTDKHEDVDGDETP